MHDSPELCWIRVKLTQWGRMVRAGERPTHMGGRRAASPRPAPGGGPRLPVGRPRAGWWPGAARRTYAGGRCDAW